ncbi:jg10615 [Pararge aegeria aegeria]|uniref:Jg10615 protein n=1 Tax=Pararge aegeria aegeria TaxID=348720 RepID=A0A8S4RC12_9NEOP|nr:jg10615 [Pararge aegeria aegeria]
MTNYAPRRADSEIWGGDQSEANWNMTENMRIRAVVVSHFTTLDGANRSFIALSKFCHMKAIGICRLVATSGPETNVYERRSLTLTSIS